MSELKRKFLNSSIASKFRTIYIVLIAVCIFINGIAAQIIYTREVRSGITGLASQTIDTISKNVGSTLHTIAKSSTYLLGTSDVQNYLQTKNSSHDAMSVKSLRNALYLSLESMPQVSSILIITEDGAYDGAARYIFPNLILSSPSQASWYQEVREKRGSLIYQVNGGGYFEPEEDNSYISLIRVVNSTQTAQPLGYMMINISMDSLLSFTRDTNNRYSDICVYLNDQPLLGFLNEDLNQWISHTCPQDLPKQSDVLIGKDRYLMLRIDEEQQEWYYLSAIPYASLSGRRFFFLLIFAGTAAVSGFLFLVIAFFTRRFITSPLARLMGSMKKTEKGEFRPAFAAPYHDEIGRLQDAYNEMVEKIQQLMASKMEEQRLLRKAELNTLQEQIKPHFLYNSLSAISYLVTTNQPETAYDMILALSDYYRESLSKGSQVVSLGTELSIVQNYLKLQKMRFPNSFQDAYEVDKQLLSLQMPRLILQPLVENALYHGILPLGDWGTIKIEGTLDNHTAILRISDDGVGMDQHTLEEILSGSLEFNRKSFGLRGTVERLRIFYEKEHIYEISSEPGKGTVITLLIPVRKGEENIWNSIG